MAKNENGAVKLKIFNQEDRLTVATILINNGYTVSQGKEKRTETGKTLDYFLLVSEDSNNADTSR